MPDLETTAFTLGPANVQISTSATRVRVIVHLVDSGIVLGSIKLDYPIGTPPSEIATMVGDDVAALIPPV